MRKKKTKLSILITALVCLVVIVALIITDLLVSVATSERLQSNIEEKAIAISRTVAKAQWVIDGLENEEEEWRVQTYTTEIQSATDVLFIVVMDMEGIRKSHPNPEEIGKRFVGGDEVAALEGREHVSISTGTLGESLRAFTPIFNDHGEQLGAVAVGISLQEVNDVLADNHTSILKGSVIGIIVGIIGALIVASYIKRALLGLEPFEIAKILEERSAMLQSAREAIIAVDSKGTITLVNKSALNLFEKAGMSGDPIGKKVTEFMPTSRLEWVLKTRQPEFDEEQQMNGMTILVNRVPIIVNDEVVGAISTFRDLTEIKQQAKQLTGVKLYVEALRAQSHEFMNKLHVILGMVKTESYDELNDYIHQIVNHRSTELNHVIKRIKDSVLAGFILGKLSYAREKHITLDVQTKSVIPKASSEQMVHELITILGNLIDNALEAVIKAKEKTVLVQLEYSNERLHIRVQDTGPGIPDGEQGDIFKKGYSTKGENRGYGLYLVKQSVEKLGGAMEYESRATGMTFYVDIPYKTRRDKR
ncbi:sensor histidine kinase [Halalkalibacterium halodurans]|uniref:histidine kinase n=1 Tax=Halalkalibacterium halodurans TaxID=86665 RepID=A0A0M0KDI1_ALKHA|nr:sensor histidine kinase [Halalkalibacterium halodurans]MED4164766.1 sensor histidine kinase [Halalkalibacterium halodurans]TPE67547.1 two-component system sensor histidine kinase DcuS [Halalkalibacterium halodurans]